MLDSWNKTIDSLSEFQEALTDFFGCLRLSPSQYKESLKVRRAWDAAQKNINDFGNFVSPIKSIYVSLPSANKEFIETWEFYKAYLLEQHGIIMRSRYELKALQRLWALSNENADEAVHILNFTMERGYPRFFKPQVASEKPDNNTLIPEDYDPHFDRR